VKTEAELVEAGRAAVVEGLRLWHLDVVDPSPRALADGDQRALEDRKVIDSILIAGGWDWMVPYAGNRRGPEWCGFFAAACWRAAGIDPKWLAPFFASTLRLHAWGHYRNWNDKANPLPAAGEQRRLVARLDRHSTVKSLPFIPREGDIVIVGDGNPAEGDHITITTGFDAEAGLVLTVEGNGGGLGPDGKRREGIVTGRRPIGIEPHCVRWIYRPSPSDLL
jgi:hypothetical protein